MNRDLCQISTSIRMVFCRTDRTDRTDRTVAPSDASLLLLLNPHSAVNDRGYKGLFPHSPFRGQRPRLQGPVAPFSIPRSTTAATRACCSIPQSPNSKRVPNSLTEALQFSPDQLLGQETGMIGDHNPLQMVILMLNYAGPEPVRLHPD